MKRRLGPQRTPMDTQSSPGNITQAIEHVHCCSICDKQFGKGSPTSSCLFEFVLTRKTLLETSHARHEQYCRRRAAIGRQPRAKACQLCSRVKSKCDSNWPCSRCVSKQAVCSYNKRRAASASGASHDTTMVTGPNSSGGFDQQPLTEAIVPWPSTGNPSWMAADAMFDTPRPSVGDSCYTACALSGDQHATLFATLQPTIGGSDLDFIPSNDIFQPPAHESTPSLSQLPLHFSATLSSDKPANIPSLITCSPVDAHSGSLQNPHAITNECRRLIMSVLRTYPLMVTRPDALPPFVHPLGCGLHFDGRDEPYRSSTDFAPLEPLAACIGIAHMFAARTVNSDGFLWRTIGGEQRRILDEVSLVEFQGRRDYTDTGLYGLRCTSFLQEKR
jgi:hypothetical protein